MSTRQEASVLITDSMLHHCCILVVDDVAVNRKLLEHSLSSSGFVNVLTAKDGMQALSITKEARPDLVILDIMMPTMDGFAYCKAVRQDESLAHMPILVQTVLEDAEQKVQAFRAGANDYICKPIAPEELVARTRIHLTQRLLLQQMIDYRTRMHEEMRTAILMQSSIMPDSSHVHMCERVFNMSIATHFETSSALGGDFWSMRPLSTTRLAITMLDFSGHGIGAAMNVFRIHTIMQECTPLSGDPAQYLAAINRQLHPLLERHEFATMFYGIIDTEANCLLYASAAMHPALLYSGKERSIVPIQGNGFALGVVAGASYETQFAPFMPGDMLLLYSDCLIETQNMQGSCLSEGKICLTAEKEMAKAKAPNAQAVVSQLCSLLKQHIPEPLADDLTICSYWRK